MLILKKLDAFVKHHDDGININKDDNGDESSLFDMNKTKLDRERIMLTITKFPTSTRPIPSITAMMPTMTRLRMMVHRRIMT